jgi:hypothetical protein
MPSAVTPADHCSPELALVCPELRAAAIAALPDRDPDAFLFSPRPARVESPEFRLLRAVDAEAEQAEDTAEDSGTPLPLAILAYAAQRSFVVAVEATAVVGVVVGALAAASALKA